MPWAVKIRYMEVEYYLFDYNLVERSGVWVSTVNAAFPFKKMDADDINDILDDLCDLMNHIPVHCPEYESILKVQVVKIKRKKQ